jgi:hypothetical protein
MRELKLILFIVVVIAGIIFVPKIMTIFGEQGTDHADQITWEVVEEAKGLEFKKLKGNLYSLTGSVRAGDCEKIAKDFPKRFVVILESPGGNLAEGICLASHLKIREVITVVRDTPVYNAEGEVVYTPGLVGEDTTRVVCASACSLMFLGGNERYLMGKVWFGIHGPRTPEEHLRNQGKSAIEQSSYQTAGRLLQTLKQLGVENERIRLSFIMIPGTSMYWLNPRDFKLEPDLIHMATHYRDFWGFSAENLTAGL